MRKNSFPESDFSILYLSSLELIEIDLELSCLAMSENDLIQ